MTKLIDRLLLFFGAFLGAAATTAVGLHKFFNEKKRPSSNKRTQ